MGRPYPQKKSEEGVKMTTSRIRWCMKCNRIVTSRKCPDCRNDVLNLHLDKGSGISPIFQNQARYIRSKIDDNYGEGCGDLLIPDDRTALFESLNGQSKMIINGGIVGKISSSGDVMLNASGLRIISSKITKNHIKCDHDSSYFVTKGRNLMVTGVTGHSEGLKEGDVVAVLDDTGVPIAEGVMKMDSEQLGSSDRGVAVKIRDCECPRTYDGRKHSNWVETIDDNSYSLGALIGETVKTIKDMQLSYGYPVFAKLEPDINSEANLLLAIEAGYKPSIFVEKGDDFVDYLIDKHGLKAVYELPEKCFLITEDDRSNDENIVCCPTVDWDPTTVWLYVMLRAEPFNPEYLKS